MRAEMFWIGMAIGYVGSIYSWPHIKDAVDPIVAKIKELWAKVF